MTNIYNFNQIEIITFIFVLIRMSAFVVSWPIFGSTLLPAPVKLLLALSLALLLFPVIDTSQMVASPTTSELMFLSIKEAFIGLSIGFLARMILFSVSIAGQIISVTMGLSGAQLFNPATGETSTPIDQFQIYLVSLLFLALNGHHLFLSALAASFEMVPLSLNLISVAGFASMGEFVQQIMIIGVKLSTPVLVAVTLMNMVMAIIGRAVPQINVLITSLSVNILVGFLVMIFSLPIVLGQTEVLLNFSAESLFRLLKTY